MQTENKRIYVITIISAVVVILLAFVLHYFLHGREEGKTVKVGFIYVGDTSTGYTNNFVNAQNDGACGNRSIRTSCGSFER